MSGCKQSLDLSLSGSAQTLRLGVQKGITFSEEEENGQSDEFSLQPLPIIKLEQSENIADENGQSVEFSLQPLPIIKLEQSEIIAAENGQSVEFSLQPSPIIKLEQSEIIADEKEPANEFSIQPSPIIKLEQAEVQSKDGDDSHGETVDLHQLQRKKIIKEKLLQLVASRKRKRSPEPRTSRNLARDFSNHPEWSKRIKKYHPTDLDLDYVPSSSSEESSNEEDYDEFLSEDELYSDISSESDISDILDFDALDDQEEETDEDSYSDDDDVDDNGSVQFSSDYDSDGSSTSTETVSIIPFNEY